MNVRSRLEIYPSKEIKGRAVIAGEKAALKELAYSILQAADNPTGFQTLNLYKGNGHDYEILITKNIKEQEWQSMPNESSNIEFIKEFDDLRKDLMKSND